MRYLFYSLDYFHLSSPDTVGLFMIEKEKYQGKRKKKDCNWGARKIILNEHKKKTTSYTLFYYKWSEPCKLLRMHNEFYTSYVKWISMSNSARGTGESLLIGSEASCIIMGQASLLSHCGSSRITRRKERERETERKKKNKGHGSWPGRVGGVGRRDTVLHSSSSGQWQTHDCPSTAPPTHTEARATFTEELLYNYKKKKLKALWFFLCLLNCLIHSLKIDFFCTFSRVYSKVHKHVHWD